MTKMSSFCLGSLRFVPGNLACDKSCKLEDQENNIEQYVNDKSIVIDTKVYML